MNRFRPWVAGLHGGQLVILLALQTLGGIAAFAGFFVVADRVGTHYSHEASVAEQSKQEKTLAALKKLSRDDEYPKALQAIAKGANKDTVIARYEAGGSDFDDLIPTALSRAAAEIHDRLLYVRAQEMDALRKAGISDSEIAADSARIAKAHQASTVFPNSLMIVGGVLLLFMWTWALLSLWWWLGERKKSAGAQ